MTNNSRKLLAFSLALGSIILCEKAEIKAEEVEEPAPQSEALVEIEESKVETTTNNIESEKSDAVEETTTNNAEYNRSTGQIEYTIDSSTEGDLVPINTNFKSGEDTLQVIAVGVTSGDKENFLAALSEYYEAKVGGVENIPIKFIDTNFIDTEKWSSVEGYDSLQCWANAASNVLWITGWGQKVYDPLIGQDFSNSDEIATYFSTYFTDKGSNSLNAYEWFIDGNYYVRTTAGSSFSELVDSTNKYQKDNGYGDGTTQLGLVKDYCADPLIKRYKFESNEDAIRILDDLGTDFAAELSVDFAGDEGPTATTNVHAITIVGIIKDPNDTTLNAYKAVLVADSDNDKTDAETPNPSTDAKDVASSKANHVNSYTLYYLEQVTDTQGRTWWNLINYSNESKYALITDIDTLKMKTEDTEKSALENYGTKNTVENTDLVLVGQYTVDETAKKSVYEYKAGDPVYFNYEYKNPSKVNYKNADDDLTVHKVEIYKKIGDGSQMQLYDTFKFQQDLKINAQSVDEYTIDLTQYMSKAFEAGDYYVSITLNVAPDVENGRAYDEAYYVNNSLSTWANFTITEEEVIDDDGEEKESIYDYYDPIVGESTTKEAVSTGVETEFAMFAGSASVAALGAVELSLKKRKELKRTIKNKHLYK